MHKIWHNSNYSKGKNRTFTTDTERGDNIQVALSTLAVINIYIYIYTRCTDKYVSDINNIPMITACKSVLYI